MICAGLVTFEMRFEIQSATLGQSLRKPKKPFNCKPLLVKPWYNCAKDKLQASFSHQNSRLHWPNTIKVNYKQIWFLGDSCASCCPMMSTCQQCQTMQTFNCYALCSLEATTFSLGRHMIPRNDMISISRVAACKECERPCNTEPHKDCACQSPQKGWRQIAVHIRA